MRYFIPLLLSAVCAPGYCFNLKSFDGYNYYPQTAEFCGARMFVSNNQIHLMSIINIAYEDPSKSICTSDSHCDRRVITMSCVGNVCDGPVSTITLLDSGDYLYLDKTVGRTHFVERSFDSTYHWCN